MIEQQLYTRSSKGYFLQNAGYDTVRFSMGLSSSDAQRYNELYTYHGGNVKGVSDKLDVITRMTLDDGNVMLCGTKPYDYMSYDGIKHVHIAHAYIMRQNSPELEEQSYDVRQIAGVTEFIASHIDGSNEPLEQLTVLPYESAYAQSDYISLINTQYDAGFFASIVYAAINSVYNGKKVYLVARKIEDIYESLDILKAIYYYIPYCLRNYIGYTTLLNNIGLPAGVNIAFVSAGNLAEAESGNLFGSIISNDYCFDLGSQRILFDGEGTLNPYSDYMSLVKHYITDPEAFTNTINVIDAQLRILPSTVQNLEQIARLFTVADINHLPAATNVYFEIQNVFGTAQPSLGFIYELIGAVSQANNGDLNLNELPCACNVYETATDEVKDYLIEYILRAVDYSVQIDDKETFLKKLLVCGDHPEIAGIVNSRFINKDSRAIALYFGEQFSKRSTPQELMEEVIYIESNQPYIDDALSVNPAFIKAVQDRIYQLYAEKHTIGFLVDTQSAVSQVKTNEIRTAVSELVTTEINAYVASGPDSAYTIDVYDLQNLITYFTSVISDAQFIKTAQWIVGVFFNSNGAAANKYYLCFGNTEPEVIKLRQYFKKHYEQYTLKNNYLAYTLAYYDDLGGYINLKQAFIRIAELGVICEYANWLANRFNYYRSSNPMKTVRGDIDREHKYAELANAITEGVFTLEVLPDKKLVNEYYDEMVQDLTPVNELLAYLHKAYNKSLKKALEGKEPDLIMVESDEPKKGTISNFFRRNKTE